MKLLENVRKLAQKKDLPPVCSAVVLAAGSSERMGSDKILAELAGMPVLVRALTPFQESEYVEEIVVVTRADRINRIADLVKEYKLDKVSKVVCGGNTRMESALAGVSEVKAEAKLIAIHDGARPLVSRELIASTVQAARDYLAAVPALPSTDTLKTVDKNGAVIGAVDRSATVRVQTPQVFTADLIKGALTAAVTKGLTLTDDCSAIARMGVKTQTVPGEEDNIKLTTPRDLWLAEAILQERRK